jgi:hypothetical protein
MRRILDEEQTIVNDALATVTPRSHGLRKSMVEAKNELDVALTPHAVAAGTMRLSRGSQARLKQ